MAEKYDKNGYNSSDFKRNAPQDANIDNEQEQDGDDNPKINEKAGEYMRELLSEKIKLNNAKFPIITKLIDQGKCLLRRTFLPKAMTNESFGLKILNSLNFVLRTLLY